LPRDRRKGTYELGGSAKNERENKQWIRRTRCERYPIYRKHLEYMAIYARRTPHEKTIRREERNKRAEENLRSALARSEAWKIRLATMPRRWDEFRKPTVNLGVGEYVDLPIPGGQSSSEWIPRLRNNLPLARITRGFKFSVKMLDEKTVRITKKEYIPTYEERLAAMANSTLDQTVLACY